MHPRSTMRDQYILVIHINKATTNWARPPLQYNYSAPSEIYVIWFVHTISTKNKFNVTQPYFVAPIDRDQRWLVLFFKKTR